MEGILNDILKDKSGTSWSVCNLNRISFDLISLYFVLATFCFFFGWLIGHLKPAKGREKLCKSLHIWIL